MPARYPRRSRALSGRRAPAVKKLLTAFRPLRGFISGVSVIPLHTAAPHPPIMKVLLVEDEPKIASYVSKALGTEGHNVEVIPRGDDGLTAATTRPFDIMLLDLALPGGDGLDILRAVRAKSISTPVLILTARGELPDRITGLDLGADDYLPKPFAMEELIARINVLTRRKGADTSPIMRVGDLVLNSTTREVT